MNDLKRFYACMDYKPVDRTPFWSWGGWPETLERWTGEGFDPDKHDLNMAADLRRVYSDWFKPEPPFKKEVVSEDDQTILYVNHEGILIRERKDNPKSSMPQFVKFPVETRQEFRQFWNERMQPDLSARIGPDWKQQLKTMRNEPYPFIVWADRWGGFFGPLRNLVGVERLCMLFYDDIAFIEEMMDATADFIIAMMSQILDVVNVEAFLLWEDMAYKTSPLISPDLVRRYMLPRYRRVTDFLFGRDVPFVGLDSDGQIDLLIPVWLDSGINVLFPFEVQAGMDVLEVRKKYGRELRIWGGVDKRVLATGPAAIDAEIMRLKPLMEQGGYIPHTDHTVPPDVPFKNYCYYMDKMAEACAH